MHTGFTRRCPTLCRSPHAQQHLAPASGCVRCLLPLLLFCNIWFRYILHLKPLDCGILLKYCTHIIGGGINQRCILSIAINTSLRLVGCDLAAITMSKCLHWSTPSKADSAFLSDKACWADSLPLEISVLTPFLNGCVLPQVALTYASRVLAAACDLQAPQPSADDTSALRLPSVVALFIGYASFVHLRAPVEWMQHAKGFITFWGERFAVDGDGILHALQVCAQKDSDAGIWFECLHCALQAMKDDCHQAHNDGVYVFQRLVPLFFNVLHQLQETVLSALQLHGEEALDCTAVNDAAAPVMVLACDISSLAAAPSVVACFSAFAAFSRQQCLETDLIKLFASLKRFGKGAGGGDLLPACKQIVAQLSDDSVGALDAVFPEHVSQVDPYDASAAAEEPARHDDDHISENELNLDGERIGDADDDAVGSCGSPLAATPPPALHGASPLLGGEFDSFAPILSTFSHTPQHHPALSPLVLQSSFAHDSFRFQDVADHGSVNFGSSAFEHMHDNVDSVFADVVSGLNSSTANIVKRAQERFRSRQAGRADDEGLLGAYEREDEEAHVLAPASSLLLQSPSSFSHVTEAEASAANKNIVERLASIESMLTKLTAAGGRFVAGPNTDSGQYNFGDDDDGHVAGADLISSRSYNSSAPLLSALRQGSEHSRTVAETHVLSPRSFDSNGTSLLSARSNISDAVQLTTSNAQALRGTTATAAEAAAKYLKNVSSTSATNGTTADFLPTITVHSQLPGETSDTVGNTVGPSTLHLNVPANRDSMQNAMRVLSGLLSRLDIYNPKSNSMAVGVRTTPDLSGASAAAVEVMLKANSANNSEAFDPSVIGASLEVTVTSLFNRSRCMTLCAGF